MGLLIKVHLIINEFTVRSQLQFIFLSTLTFLCTPAKTKLGGLACVIPHILVLFSHRLQWGPGLIIWFVAHTYLALIHCGVPIRCIYSNNIKALNLFLIIS